MNDEAVIWRRVAGRLERLYGTASAEALLPRFRAMVDAAPRAADDRPAPWSQRHAMLFAYGDTLRQPDEPPLSALHRFLRERVGDAISHLHLLPFFPYTSDDGFAVTDYRAVRDDLGTWDDIAALADDYDLVFDAVINHVSADSVYMQRYRAGDAAADGFFVALDPKTDTSSVLRTRNLPLLHPYETPRGTEWLWTTFGPDQIDLNFANPQVLLEILDVLLGYASRGAPMLRLDAIPYLWKELGTSCAHLPQTHELIKLIRDVLDLTHPRTLILTETNCPHHENLAYFGDAGDEAQVIYNFTLAPLILHAIVRGDASILTDWARQVRPISHRATYLNVTATHDGIGMRPTEGILPEAERRMMCDLAEQRGAGITGKRNPDGSVSVYELNVTYFDALNDPNADEPRDLQVARFLLSQTIAMSFLGLPGIYIHSLLGSRNDMAGVQHTGRARSINRAQLDVPALERELAEPTLRRAVFDGYLHLLRRRAAEPALSPLADQEVLDFGPSIFALRRTHPATGHSLLAVHNVTPTAQKIDGHGTLGPYEARWISEA